MTRNERQAARAGRGPSRDVLLASVLSGTLAALMLAGCAMQPAAAPPQPLTEQQIVAVVNAPDRSAADRRNDQRRKPEAMLSFIGLRPGLTVLDVSAGGGYTTELLARSIGPTGKVYGQSPPRNPDRPPPAPAAPEGGSGQPGDAASAALPAAASTAVARPAPRTLATVLADRQQHLQSAGIAVAPMTPISQTFENPVPAAMTPGGLDGVTLMFNYHDLGFMGVDRTRMNQALFAALKPGGFYVIADHAGRPGTGISESGTLHRVEQAFVEQEVQAAGFRLAARGEFLRNPADPRDRNEPDPPQAKDEFVLKFVKP